MAHLPQIGEFEADQMIVARRATIDQAFQKSAHPATIGDRPEVRRIVTWSMSRVTVLQHKDTHALSRMLWLSLRCRVFKTIVKTASVVPVGTALSLHSLYYRK